MSGANPQPSAVDEWHALVASPDAARLAALIAPDAVFKSPAVHTPQQGAERTRAYLWAALQVIGPTLRYGQEWVAEGSAVLQFTATVDGLDIEGVDVVRWDENNKIVEFTVMVRPYKALGALIAAMGAALVEVKQ